MRVEELETCIQSGYPSGREYAIYFRTRARLSDWNAAAQCDVFLTGLADYVKDELVPFDLPASLDGLIELASRVDQRVLARRQERRQSPASVMFPYPSGSQTFSVRPPFGGKKKSGPPPQHK
ncbi:hypothetical protein NHX12_004481 [Muraenolepis orangiensis]|uniref:Uncharacterized protein n=1 Tax=Muraenolepis orangiensis TaxID=630683 RepID=A0A9Q0DVD5_9TELE|nr:hypothetical protein NHX12_004481 [Muraenolepis orangiensis]